MKPTFLVGIAAAGMMLGGCQSLNWTAKNKDAKENAVAERTIEREVPWTWGKKKPKSETATDLPPELQAKFDKANGREASTKTSAEWVTEGNQLEIGRNFAAATKAYESALLVDPVNAEAHHRLGIMADMRQEYGTAQDHYEAALRQKPHDPNLLSDFGYSFHLQNKPQRSERLLLQSLDLDPQHKQALKNLVTLYSTLGRYDDALQVCRRLRPEAEAQQLMAQFFPKGRPMPDGDQLASDRNAAGPRGAAPMPPEIAKASLKNKSPEEMYQLMAELRQAGVQARQQKSLAEFRPDLHDSLPRESEHPAPGARLHNSQPRPTAGEAWAQDDSGGERQRSVPPSLEQVMRPPPSSAEFAANPSPRQPLPTDDPPLWNGAPLAARGNAPAEGAMSHQPGSWGTNDGAGLDNSAAFHAQRHNSDFPERNSAFGQASPSNFSSGPLGREGAASPQTAQNLRAYQLAMSAGPGTMFPLMPADAVQEFRQPSGNSDQPVEVNQASGLTGPPQWSNSTTPGGYSETRVGETAEGESGSSQWQTAPVDIGPRPPNENWGSPSTIPWPDRAGQNPQGAEPASQRQPSHRMPMITPGTTGGNTGRNDSRRSNSSVAPAAAESDSGGRPGTSVVPAWFDGPASDRRASTRSGNATSVQQWPYAPQ